MSRIEAIRNSRSQVAPSVISDLLALIKVRPVSLVLLSVITGFILGSEALVQQAVLILTLLGSFLVGAGAMALNEWMERDIDGKMIRTRNRPLPTGRMQPKNVFMLGISFSVLGLGIFIMTGLLLAGLIAFATLLSYLLIYTPLKRKTSLATVVGAVPGALPILIGWAAARGSTTLEAWSLFFIIFFWQMPHFLSIAWMYRSDYARAGLPMLSVVDRGGMMVARQMILYVCALVPVSLLPTVFGLVGSTYFFSIFCLGLLFSAVIVYAAVRLDSRARLVLRASIVYLSLLFVLMIADKI